MKLTSALALFGGISSVSAAVGCYGGGNGVNFYDANYHVKRACEGYSGVAGAFQGWFAPNQEKYACVNMGYNVKLEMWVKNLNTVTGFDLGDTDCTRELQIINSACRTGGDRDVAGWYFR